MSEVSIFGVPWLHFPLVKAVELALGADNIRFVGGAVRDTVIGRPIKDIDIATPLKPDEVVVRLEKAGIKVAPTGLQHGTVTAHLQGSSLEITTLRVDVKTYGRHADVAFTENWQQDAERRDFTMNAIYADTDGKIYDLTGGVADAKAGRVRFIGSARERIREDGLRILRFFRFYAHYGRGPVDVDTLTEMRQHADMLARLSVERVRDEILKLLAARQPLSALQLMAQTALMKQVIGLEPDLGVLKKTLDAEADTRPGAIRRLAAILPPSPDLLERFAENFKLSGADTKYLLAIAAARADIVRGVHTLRVQKFLFGGNALQDALIIEKPGQIDALKDIPDLVFPLQGRDLIAHGVAPGVEMGRLLASAKAHWLKTDCQLDKQQLMTWLNRRL